MSGAKLEQALNISLDDYIAKKGIVSTLRPKASQSPSSPGESHFKRPLRSDMEEDDDNADDLILEDRQGDPTLMDTEDPPLPIVREISNAGEEIEEIDTEKKPTNVSIQLDSERECRTFTTEEHKRGIKQMPSQQWRLRRENQVSKKPAGVPPLISVKSIFDRNTDELIASMNEHTRFQDADAQNRATQQLRNNRRHWNNSNNNRGQYNQNRNRFNNGFQNRNNYNNHRRNGNRHSGFMPNVSGSQMDKSQIKDLRPFISHSSMMHPQSTAGSGLWRPMDQPQQLVTFADMLSQIGQAADSRNRDAFADVIRNVMQTQQQQQSPAALVPMITPENFTRMNSMELMPFAAQTMLNHITTVQQNFGPKYDMKLQKEIHSLQGKPMFYGSNGIVVSSDGSGVGDERVTPVSTDLSMNMRFS